MFGLVYLKQKKRKKSVSHAAARRANVLISCHQRISLEHKIKFKKKRRKDTKWVAEWGC